ncbi:MAG: helix-turn-helix domain containing protein [Fusobacterium sp.]
MEKETQLKKFKIIEPFLRKEKKLRDIEKESGISYATLKRWIKAYKEEGVLGLDKKERQDKNSFRAVDDKGMDIIKKVCRESSEANISQLYDKCRKFLKKNIMCYPHLQNSK